MFQDFYAGGISGANVMSFYDRGINCGMVDLVEAHKWFNLAALSGDIRGTAARADLAQDMDAREIAEAQRRARTFMRERPRSL